MYLKHTEKKATKPAGHGCVPARPRALPHHELVEPLHELRNMIKVDRLGLAPKNVMACLDMLDVHEAFEEFLETLSDFDREHDHRWQIAQNGKIGGYLSSSSGKGATVVSSASPGAAWTWTRTSRPGRPKPCYSSRPHLGLRPSVRPGGYVVHRIRQVHTTEEREILVPHKIKVAVPTGTDG